MEAAYAQPTYEEAKAALEALKPNETCDTGYPASKANPLRFYFFFLRGFSFI